MSSWIAFTILAAFMQSIRTAGQKELSSNLTPMSATLVRYLYGLPLVASYLVLLLGEHTWLEVSQAINNSRFVVYATLAGISQIVATVLLVKVFSFRNFAVGTSFAKTEAVQTAVFGLVFFSAALSVAGWLAVFIGFLGIAVVSFPATSQAWDWRNIVIGTASGTAFAFTSLWLREASLSLNTDGLHSAALTLFFMVVLQTLICLTYSVLKEPGEIKKISKRRLLATFVGATSALGSIGWFTAMTLQNAALVKSLGQIEFIFTLLITTFFFKEKISPREFLGMVLIVISVIVLLQ
ncbi:MAG: DMT family transporter [Gammaproteobacteria bacterium]|nr:DMT family transporter [Gammaproteobacteria bacterium]